MPESDFQAHELVTGGYKQPYAHTAKKGLFFNAFDPEHPDRPGLLLKRPKATKDRAEGFHIRGTIGKHGGFEFSTDSTTTWAGPDHIGELDIYIPGNELTATPMGMLSPEWACIVEVV